MPESLKERRHRVKMDLVLRKGGACEKCGYSRALSALCFHHREPTTKTLNISGVRLTRHSRSRLEAEVDKCDLLCLNCHAEFHDEEGWVHEGGKRTRW